MVINNSEAASAAVAAEAEKVSRGVSQQPKAVDCDSCSIAVVSGEGQLVGRPSKALVGKAQRSLAKLA